MNLVFFILRIIYQNPNGYAHQTIPFERSSVADRKTKTHYRCFHSGEVVHQENGFCFALGVYMVLTGSTVDSNAHSFR
jgi:hypothetical protein